jgi:hypothetical protein
MLPESKLKMMRSSFRMSICNADITLNWNDIRNAYMNELDEIAQKMD